MANLNEYPALLNLKKKISKKICIQKRLLYYTIKAYYKKKL